MRILPLLGATGLALMVQGCTSLDSLNQFPEEWDQKHAPGTGILGSRTQGSYSRGKHRMPDVEGDVKVKPGYQKAE